MLAVLDIGAEAAEPATIGLPSSGCVPMSRGSDKRPSALSRSRSAGERPLGSDALRLLAVAALAELDIVAVGALAQ